MYDFQEPEPASRPPPVSFSPPKAPPISAPDGPILTLAMPQSEPVTAMNASASRMSSVKMEEDRPAPTPVNRSASRARLVQGALHALVSRPVDQRSDQHAVLAGIADPHRPVDL